MTEQVAITGFAVPPVPAGGVQHSREGTGAPPAPVQPIQAPTPVVPAAPSATPELQALLDKALQAAQPKPSGESINMLPVPTGGLNDHDIAGIDNPQLRSLSELFTSQVPNLDVERALGVAIDRLDPTLIDVAYLRDVAGDKSGPLAELARQIVGLVQAESAAQETAVFAAAGGEAQWNAAAAAFNQNAPAYLKEVCVALLNSSSSAKVINGAQAIVDFARQGGFVVNAAELVTATGGRSAEPGISKAEYQQLLQEVKPEHLNKNWMQERQSLYQRRAAGKARGI